MYINYNFNTNCVTSDHSLLLDFYLFLKKKIFYNHLLCVDTHPHHSEYAEVEGQLAEVTSLLLSCPRHQSQAMKLSG